MAFRQGLVDVPRLQAVRPHQRQLSEEYGFQYVPTHAFNPDVTDDLNKKPASGATYAAGTEQTPGGCNGVGSKRDA